MNSSDGTKRDPYLGSNLAHPSSHQRRGAKTLEKVSHTAQRSCVRLSVSSRIVVVVEIMLELSSLSPLVYASMKRGRSNEVPVD